jgi:hypothetical protein
MNEQRAVITTAPTTSGPVAGRVDRDGVLSFLGQPDERSARYDG